MKSKKSKFSGSIGFVLAAAGSAVGVGNIWRFPYLCAKDGGGLFLLIYLILVLTFGFTLLTTDVAIGRKTKQNALNAYATLHEKWRFLGYLTFLVPTLIMTYYSVIGGWILKYLSVYVVSNGHEAAQDNYFTSLYPFLSLRSGTKRYENVSLSLFFLYNSSYRELGILQITGR